MRCDWSEGEKDRMRLDNVVYGFTYTQTNGNKNMEKFIVGDFFRFCKLFIPTISFIDKCLRRK